MTMTKSGYAAIVGRPNVGKSTLLNAILEKKISITSSKPQTTRTSILGIKTTSTRQTIYIDTPGLHRAGKKAMNRYMNRLASSVIPDADVIIFMIEALVWRDDDELTLEKLHTISTPVLLVINKVDAVKEKNHLLPFIDKVKDKFPFKEIIPLSAKKKENVTALEKIIAALLPEGPFLFPEDQITDKSTRFQVAELIREKILQTTHQELPYSTSVEIESFEMKNNIMHIHAIIWVEREGQKSIVIGKDGERLKKMSTEARIEIEKIVAKKVFLRVWVKMKKGWSDDEKALRSLGYGSSR